MGKVEHDRETCIGCGACTAIHPDGWEMAPDGKSDIKGATNRDDGWQEKETSGEDLELHLEAAQSCPVNCIHITDDKGEKRA